jgi:hypothetical protein
MKGKLSLMVTAVSHQGAPPKVGRDADRRFYLRVGVILRFSGRAPLKTARE